MFYKNFSVIILSLFLISCYSTTKAQEIPNIRTQETEETDSTKILNKKLDSLFIYEVEDKYETDKVLHAEPLYIDLIRDLGARKGEKEWNIGIGAAEKRLSNEYEALIEYEFAPIDRLGLEIELPFLFYTPDTPEISKDSIPNNRLNGLKLAAQYSFFVSEKIKTSMAIGYLHEFEMADFAQYGKSQFIVGNVYNPFFIAAKRWGDNYHTLVYAGPVIEHHFLNNSLHTTWQINSNFHYMITGTRNFIGVEVNKEITSDSFSMTLRPQMRVGLADNLLIGIVAGFPVNNPKYGFSSFMRLIYEPGHKYIDKGKH
jgi:hypothetical protein